MPDNGGRNLPALKLLKKCSRRDFRFRIVNVVGGGLRILEDFPSNFDQYTALEVIDTISRRATATHSRYAWNIVKVNIGRNEFLDYAEPR